MITEQDLLNEYKKYDYLNQDKDNPLVKIFVSYIKPSFLFKSEILTPIHLGRAVEKDNSKDGKISDDDINWLHENCIGDDDFEGNISHVNRRVGFLTGTYWAWKNYEKLGNPEYFGSFGYRRLLEPKCLENIKKYDIIIPKATIYNKSLGELFKIQHGNEYFDAMMKTLSRVFPEDINLAEIYFNNSLGYMAEIYIMKKEIFFEFCEWIFAYLNNLMLNYKKPIEMVCGAKSINFQKKLNDFLQIENPEKDLLLKKEIRDWAFIIERITGFYIYKLSQNNQIKFIEHFTWKNDSNNAQLAYNSSMLIQMRKKVKQDVK